MSITEQVHTLLGRLPGHVTLEAAVKARSADEINQAVAAGVRVIGQNYLQDAERTFADVRGDARRHFIGHVQTNKVKKVVGLFDMIETVDSAKLAAEIDKRCAQIGKTMDVLIEVNSAREPQKSGVFPEHVLALADEIAAFPRLVLRGVMTMGAAGADEATLRGYFRETKGVYDTLVRRGDTRMRIDILSMGMSDSYNLAIEEGANMVRIGTALFGERA